jgi:hypothetical protein
MMLSRLAVVGHALHLATIVTDAEIALLEDVEPGVELQNTWLTIAEELSLDREPRLACALRRLPNNLMELGREGVEDPCHHDAVQSTPTDGRIGDVREDVVVEGITMKREKHEVTPPLVVWRWGFQNDRNHRSYILEGSSLRGEGGIGVGAGVDGAIIDVVLGNHDTLGSGELLFQVIDNGLLLFPSEGGGALACPCLVQDLACGSHGGKMRASFSRCAVVTVAWAAAVTSSFLLAVVAVACCSSIERLKVLPGMVGKTVVVRGGGGWRRTQGFGQR